MPTIEPLTVSPPSTVWKIGRRISFSRRQADADQRAAAGERSERLLEGGGLTGRRDRLVGAAERLDRRDRVLLAGVDEVLGAELARGVQPLLVDVDRDDRGAR